MATQHVIGNTTFCTDTFTGYLPPGALGTVNPDYVRPRQKPDAEIAENTRSQRRLHTQSMQEIRLLVRTLRAICKDKKAKASERLAAVDRLIALKGYGPDSMSQRNSPLAELTKSVNIVTNNVNHEQSPEK